jgi:transcription-repair coupling factor (superfamily II helicase)
VLQRAARRLARQIMAWFQRIQSSQALLALAEKVRLGGHHTARGVAGSATTVLAGALHVRLGCPVLLVVAHLDEAADAAEELRDLGVPAWVFPAMEASAADSAGGLETALERLRASDPSAQPRVTVAPVAALMQSVAVPARRDRLRRAVKIGQHGSPAALAEWLAKAGYRRTEAIESPGDFAVRGGVVDVFPPAGQLPIRLDHFGDELESLHEIDVATQASDRKIDGFELPCADGARFGPQDGDPLPGELLAREALVVWSELSEVMEQARGYWERVVDSIGVSPPKDAVRAVTASARATLTVNHFTVAGPDEIQLPFATLPGFDHDSAKAFERLGDLAREGSAVLLAATEGDQSRAAELVRRHGLEGRVQIERRLLGRGFRWLEAGERPLSVVPEHELLNRTGPRRRKAAVVAGPGTDRVRDAFLAFEPGDYVTHRDHGVARYLGLTTLARLKQGGEFAADGAGESEYLTLEFEGSTKLHVPAARVDLVQKYIGAGAARPPLSTIGGKRWKAQKERVSEAVRDLAGEMLRVQAVRAAMPGVAYPPDTPWQSEFEAAFPYEETPDQRTAIAAVQRDMQQTRPMDRLVCGDVGFGKTEIAIRAAFRACAAGKQVAVLVPTTVLAEQHERTFRDRFRAYPFRVEGLSRFKTAAEQSQVLADLEAGKVDLIIGTHRLLSKDVVFKDLGLVVVDEEQRFGVEHKQRLLAFRATADVLTLSATPIPRTLHMSLLGLRDISSLTTPPPDRRAIVTEVIPFSAERLQQAIKRELAREGQVYYVHNRIKGLEEAAERIRRLVPEARIEVGHGQMPPEALERVMLAFMRHECDVLVSTSIIESGVDNPRANTMFIDLADLYGLADLHQLRGRVGRSGHRAYCYLFLPQDRPVTDEALRRLKAIEDYSMLGAGFRIAMRDLEIRGAGNLLGAEQSGHIAAVGYEMYCQLLEEAVDGLQNRERPKVADVLVNIGAGGWIPRGYVPSDRRRLEVYRRAASVQDPAAVECLRSDLVSAYGDPPPAVQGLLDVAEIRAMAGVLGARSVEVSGADLVIRCKDPAPFHTAFKGMQGSVRDVGGVGADGLREVYVRPPKAFLEPASLLAVLRKRLGPLVTDAVASQARK